MICFGKTFSQTNCYRSTNLMIHPDRFCQAPKRPQLVDACQKIACNIRPWIDVTCPKTAIVTAFPEYWPRPEQTAGFAISLTSRTATF
jgi:hypothetical protein